MTLTVFDCVDSFELCYVCDENLITDSTLYVPVYEGEFVFEGDEWGGVPCCNECYDRFEAMANPPKEKEFIPDTQLRLPL